MDPPFNSHYRECTNGCGWVWERPCLLQSETHCKGSQTKAAWSRLHKRLWPRATLHQCVRAEGKGKKQPQDKKLLPKWDEEGITIHSQNNAHPFWPGYPWPALITGVGRAMYWPRSLILYYWLISLNIIISRSIHAVPKGKISFLYVWAVSHCANAPPFFIHASPDGHLGCYQIGVV